tara:strand:+ start:547 stop:942 length:396 start_codon:yes stop_codon:yes gene_type:complete
MGEDAVVAVINYDDRVLIGKKRSDSQKRMAGEWHVLGEGLESGESDEDGLIRCGREEVRLEITVGDFIGQHITPTSGRTARWYECFADTDEIYPSSDLEDAKWVSKAEVLGYCSSRVDSWSEDIRAYFERR